LLQRECERAPVPEFVVRERAFFTANRGDGSFDYNCDGSTTKERSFYNSSCTSYDCSVTPTSWDDAPGNCGQAVSNYQYVQCDDHQPAVGLDCYDDWFGVPTFTQACH
jgi:hypothetical protein